MTGVGRWGLLLPALLLLPACGPRAEPPEPSPVTTVAATAPTTTTDTTTDTTTTTAPPEATTTTTTPPPLRGLTLEPVAEGLHQPTFLAAPPGDERLFVSERTGRIVLIDPVQGPLPEPFLDLRHLVGSAGIEQGLLGMAFHPEYPSNGRLFVYFTDRADDTRLVEFEASGSQVDPDRGRVVLIIEQPAIRHNGGMLQFGPDGYLYVAVGDGAAGGWDAQRTDNLLGSILRLDVDGGHPYGVPPDNPFVEGGGAPEVWAYGLRNPWRFSIDPVELLVYIGDVGQADREEINVASPDRPGLNFGWPIMEGSSCFLTRDCDREGLEPPTLEYPHAEGCSVTGGFVYRGEAIPELDGHYLYSDWCAGWIRSFRLREGGVTEARDHTEELGAPGQVNSFGLDAGEELYVLTWDGRVLRLEAVR